MKIFSSSFLGLCLISNMQICLAQVRPDTGGLLKQIENVKSPVMPQSRGNLLNLESNNSEQITTENETRSISVLSFRFIGNTVITSEQLSRLTIPFIGRSISFSELQTLIKIISTTYSDAGWLARVYVPAQDITEGVIVIKVIESKLGQVLINEESKRVPVALSRATIEANTTAGAPLNTQELNRAIALVSRIPGVAVSGSLAAGKAIGETDVLLNLVDTPLLYGNASVDNNGSRMTGATRASVNVSLASPFGKGHLGAANLIKTEGSEYLRLSHTLPINPHGVRAGINASHLSYQVTATEFDALDIHGKASTLGLDAAFPISVSTNLDSSVSVSLDQKAFSNYASTSISSSYATRMMALILSARASDTWLRAGTTDAVLQISRGRLNFGDVQDIGEDSLIPKNYEKLNLSLQRNDFISEMFSISFAYKAQYTNQNLDSSEKFYLGGAAGVRAFPSGEGGGDRGELFSVSARMRMSEKLTADAFYDYGRITVNARNDPLQIASPASLNRFSLRGVGLSISYAATVGSRITATLARRVSDSPIRNSVTGYDTDGSLSLNRFWLNANLTF